MKKYQVFEERVRDMELGEYVTYGIRSEGGAKVSDVSLDYEAILNFVREMNEGDVEETHFYDVIEDFAAS